MYRGLPGRALPWIEGATRGDYDGRGDKEGAMTEESTRRLGRRDNRARAATEEVTRIELYDGSGRQGGSYDGGVDKEEARTKGQ